jgi:hypothetical protein
LTTLYDVPPAAGPGTHVLAIGVGRYPHLLGGEPGKLAAKPLGLKQLSSPPLSTAKLLEWCLAPTLEPTSAGHSNPSCPLASVEALISSAIPVSIATPAGNQAPEAATLDNIDAAFSLWLDRVKSHNDNIGLFYFCGHGIMVADHYLLAEDFGRNNNKPWDRAFDVSNTIRAVEREVKGAVYFLVDACRMIALDVAVTLGADPSALKAVDLKKEVTRQSLSVIKATGEGELAFALENKVSRFTDALHMALSGRCGVKAAGAATWDVDGETLASAVRKLLDNGNKTAKRRQVSAQEISGASMALTKSAAIPSVAVEVDLTPETKRKVAKISLTSAKGNKHLHDGAEGVFRAVVPRGFYTVEAEAKAGEFAVLKFEDEELIPPVFDLTMSTSP